MMRRFHTQFSEKNLTSHAGLVHLGRFAEKLNLAKRLSQHITIKRGKNADYQIPDIVLVLMMSVLAGAKHLSHTVWKIIVHADSAFFVGEVLDYLEEKSACYLIKVKMKGLTSLLEAQKWKKINNQSGFEQTEFQYRCNGWKEEPQTIRMILINVCARLKHAGRQWFLRLSKDYYFKER